MEYRKRIVDSTLDLYLKTIGAVIIEGAKWCGKTTTGTFFAKSILKMHDPKNIANNIMLAKSDPGILLQGDTPRLVDEWQLAPVLWDAVRFEVDERGKFGQFILTGSAKPVDFADVHHTGTGRIARLLMRPMSLYESGDSNGQISLRELFSGGGKISGQNLTDLNQIAYLICRGGWPQSLTLEKELALIQPRHYCDSIVNGEVEEGDGVRRDATRMKLLLKSYARHVATQAKFNTILEDLQANTSISMSTLTSYVDYLRKIFVIEDGTAWNPNLRSSTAIRTGNTRYFTDPAIATAALGVGPGDLVMDFHTMGLLFENLCIRDLRVYAQANDGEVYHYRDRNGLECDAIIHLRNGKYGLVEIKLASEDLIEQGVENLNKLNKILATDKIGEPCFKMVVVGAGEYAYRRKDGVHIVPIRCLKD